MSSRSAYQTRRLFLRSAGASIALPYLPSLVGSRGIDQMVLAEPDPGRQAISPDTPRRFCCIYFPNGVSLPPGSHPAHHDWHWFPHETGANYALTRPLQPLRDLQSELTIISGLSHPATRNMVAHAAGDSFLTGADQSEGYANSVSLDQVFASSIATKTRFTSLTLSSDGGVGTPGRAKTLAYTHSGKPIPSLSSPRRIFNRLFGVEKQSVEQQRRAIGFDRSILDSVVQETRAIERKLAPADRQKFDEYISSVREIEQRLERSDRWLDVQKPSLRAEQFELDASPGDGAEDYIRAILDLMHAAIFTDSTRALTYQITCEDGKGIGDRFPNFLGLKGHHSLSHDYAKGDGYVEWARYDQFLTNQLAYFLERLRATDEPNGHGTLLDNTMVYYGCCTSRTHKAVNYPLILAGAQNMGLVHGQHRRVHDPRIPLSNLYVTMLNRLGVPVERFADSTGRLDDILG